MKARVALVAFVVGVIALFGGFALGQQSVQSRTLLSNDRLDVLLAARFNAVSDVASVMSPSGASVFVNALDRQSVVRAAPSAVVQVLDLCDPRARTAISRDPMYHPTSLARFCAERTSAK